MLQELSRKSLPPTESTACVKLPEPMTTEELQLPCPSTGHLDPVAHSCAVLLLTPLFVTLAPLQKFAREVPDFSAHESPSKIILATGLFVGALVVVVVVGAFVEFPQPSLHVTGQRWVATVLCAALVHSP